MLRIKPHVLAAALIVVLVQLLTAAPLAHARPVAGSPAPGAVERWVAAALSWLDRILTGSEPRPVPPGAAGSAGPLTGSCIDPQGNRPCS